MTRYDDQGRRLCTATTTKGQPCRAPAVIGAKVCRFHGAAEGTPGRDAADRVRLNELVGPALVALRAMVTDEKTPAPVRLGAIRETLDRTGYVEAYTGWTTDELFRMLEEALVREADELDPEVRAAREEREQAHGRLRAVLTGWPPSKVDALARRLQQEARAELQQMYRSFRHLPTGRIESAYVDENDHRFSGPEWEPWESSRGE